MGRRLFEAIHGGPKALCLLVQPYHGLGLYVVGRAGPSILSTAARQPADGSDGHVVVADDLAAESHAGQAAGGQNALFGSGHPLRLARDKFHPACRTSGVAAAGVELVDFGFIL
jgi:hypothetical protein